MASDTILKEVDRDGSGEVEYLEFVEIMTSSLRSGANGAIMRMVSQPDDRNYKP